MSDPVNPHNKFRAAVDVLNRGRDVVIDDLADSILDQAEDLIQGGFLLNEFIETQGTRVHFLCLLISQLEQASEALDEKQAQERSKVPAPSTPAKKRRSRAKSGGTRPAKASAKELPRQAAKEEPGDDA